MEQVVGGKFKLGKKIGSGSFGELYLGEWVAASLVVRVSFVSGCALVYACL